MKDTVTVMVEDNWISVDGEEVQFKEKINLVKGHEKLWALHWKNGEGEYQFDNPPKNFFFKASKYEKYVAPYVAQWEAEKNRILAKIEAWENSAEHKEQKAREERELLLKESDYILMPDYPATEENKTAWAEYRQALRDLPEQEGWPVNIVWPKKPE